MSVFKRAMLFIIRKSASSILLVAVLTIVFAFLQLGMSFMIAAAKETKNIRESVGGVFTLSPLMDYDGQSLWDDIEMPGGTVTQVYTSPLALTDDMAGQILEVDGVDRYNAESLMDGFYTELELRDGFATTLVTDRFLDSDYNSGNVTEDDKMYFSRMMSAVTLKGNTNSEDDKFFRIGAYELIKGEPVGSSDMWKAVISEEVARNNGLDIGDTFGSDITEELIESEFGNPAMIPAEFVFEVAGIYRINFSVEPSEHTYEWEMPENMVFISNDTMAEIIRHSGGTFRSYHGITFFAEDAAELDRVIDEVQTIDGILWEYIDIGRDDSAFEAVRGPLDTINNIGILLILSSAIGGFLILFLIITMQTQRRRREIGIYLAVGISKRKIAFQFLTELLVIGGMAFLLAVILTFALITPIGDSINEIMSPDDDFPQYIAGLNELEKFDVNLSSGEIDIDYEKGLTYLAPGIMGATLIIASVLISSKRILKKEPIMLLTDV